MFPCKIFSVSSGLDVLVTSDGADRTPKLRSGLPVSVVTKKSGEEFHDAVGDDGRLKAKEMADERGIFTMRIVLKPAAR